MNVAAPKKLPIRCRLGLHEPWLVSAGQQTQKKICCYVACKNCGKSDGKPIWMPKQGNQVIDEGDTPIEVRQELAVKKGEKP